MVAALTAAALSWLWCKILPVVGPPLGYVDEPGRDALKTHEVRAIPLAGPGLLIAVLVPMLWIGRMDPTILAGLVILTLLGAIDDRVGLSPGVRLGVEVSAAAVLCAELWNDSVGYFLFSVVVVVVAVNAVNPTTASTGSPDRAACEPDRPGAICLSGGTVSVGSSAAGCGGWWGSCRSIGIPGGSSSEMGGLPGGAAIALGVTVSRAGDGVLTRLAVGLLGMFLVTSSSPSVVGSNRAAVCSKETEVMCDRLVHSGCVYPP